MERLKLDLVEKPLLTEDVREQLELVSQILKWGTNGTKSLETLYREIECGESILSLDEDGNIIRNIDYVAIEVYFSTSNQIFRLREDRREFKNGFIETRDSEFESVFEKMKKGENATDAAFRGIEEELGIESEGIRLLMRQTEPLIYPPQESNSYPGIPSVHTKYSLNALIDEKYFNHNGYIERQKDKTTYFKWELLHKF